MKKRILFLAGIFAIGFRMGGIHPTCGRLDRVGVMARKAFSRFAAKCFAYEGKIN